MTTPVESAKKEPGTKFGQFYRAHRPEVLAGGGIIVAALAYWKSKHPSSGSTSASSSIDPATGYPAGSAADQAALAQQSGAGVTTPYSSTGDGSTGYSLQGLQASETADQTLLQGLTPSSTGNPTPSSPSVRTLAQAKSLTAANLAKDEAALKKNPKNKADAAAVKNLKARQQKQNA